MRVWTPALCSTPDVALQEREGSFMSKGLLVVKGTIDITQFWPEHEADGDTVRVLVSHDGGFKFSPNGDRASLKVTHVFDSPLAIGATTTTVSQGTIIVRLQHIDAAELHYPGSKNFRQYFGETAATELDALITGAGKQPVKCEVRTAVDHPHEVFDTYGRLIGDIILHPNSQQEINVNHWMVENGWAFPAFYNSASVAEIEEVSQHAAEAKSNGKGIWPHLTSDLAHPDLSLVFRPGAVPDPQADIGPVLMPKLFRRLVAWQKAHDSGDFPGTLVDYLAAQTDPWARTSDFLRNPNIEPEANNLAALVYDQGFFELGPSEIVFFEKPSTVADAWGREIDSWWGEFAKRAAA